MSSIARNEGESFAAYKERREEDNYQTQQALEPKMFWDSYLRGTYKNPNRKVIKAARATRKLNKKAK